jgi:hypothetical protein
MERKGMERFAPLAGVLFIVLAIASVIVGGDPPDADASTQKIVDFYSDNETENIISAVLGAWATVAFLWFAGVVRANVACAERPGSRLASVVMAGASIFATGLFILSGLQFILADMADEVSPEAAQALHVLYDGLWLPLVGGLCPFLLAAGLGAIRHGAFPTWLGWIAIVLGVVCLTPLGFIGFLAGLVWILIASIVLFLKANAAGAGAAPPPAGPEAPAAPPTAPI